MKTADRTATEIAHWLREYGRIRDGSGRIDADFARAAEEIERLLAVNASLLAELHHHFGCDPECEKRHEKSIVQ